MTRPFVVVLLVCFMGSPTEALARGLTRALEVVIPSEGGRRLAGTLTLPEGFEPPFPVAVSLTGSGAHFRDGNRTPDHPYQPFRAIAKALAAKGVAMLRLDDRGVGGSTGNADEATGDDVAEDTRVAIAWLRRRADIDALRVAVIGHSFGGAGAPLVAARDPRIAAVVLMGAPAGTFRATMRYQHGYRIATDPRIAPEDRAEALRAAMRRVERNIAASTQKWRQWSWNRDPLPTARLLRCPVLILQGLTDRAVSPDEARTLEETIRKAGNARVTLRLFEGLNHHFNADPVGATNGYDRLPHQDVAPAFLEAISDWLGRTLSIPRLSSGERRFPAR